MNIKSCIKKLKLINDDGWITSIFICTLAIFFLLPFAEINFLFCVFIVVGILYEHIIEWLAHGWLQHYRCNIFSFFNKRHERHHKNTLAHHALQPITILVPAICIILIPFILILFFVSNGLLKSISMGVISGFLSAHIYLNLLHYDIHSINKIFPVSFRNTWYYKRIYEEHINHHIEHENGVKCSKYRVYGISNPWLDILLEKVGASSMIDKLYPRFVKFLEDKFEKE